MRRVAPWSRHLRACRFIRPSRPFWGTVVPYKLTDVGEGIRRVEVLAVCVRPGDKVEEFDKICEIQSDKATVDITSRYAGVVAAVHVTVGGTAEVGRPIVDIELSDGAGGDTHNNKRPNSTNKNTRENINANENKPSQKDAMHGPAAAAAAAASTPAKVLATPATRGFARERCVNLAQVHGTGENGRILKEDVEAHASGYTSNVGDVVVPLNTGIRRVMVASMKEAGAIPSFTACDEMEVTALLKLRELLKDAIPAHSSSSNNGGNGKLSLTPLFLKVASLALRQHAEVNAHVTSGCESLIVKKAHNIGVAMDTPKGLIVPVIRNVERKSIVDIALELNDLVALGRRNQIQPDCLRDGTFTLSNIGSVGATYAMPMILPPQVAIGAIGRVQVLPRFDTNGNVVRANIVQVSWTADHRVINGAALVRFSNTFKHYLENPGLVLGDMMQKLP
ncbi:putative dihydrolipoamide branched chain transacylase [Trypanosoma grayi]|uniref:putative dihydrolipoamide branched chain transacylase n=1 Tax=Trypanosoma grayi TaxID=71804 RepID=UPI0004F44490|nr:putative dihydrolipoamide branched chain transacylase [Trypanosoma grayi]KEG07986.1 putative dihydrolipoamide branched chain transacylase [Trypanosoma grayi]